MQLGRHGRCLEPSGSPLEPELKPDSGWHLSSLNLIDGLEVQEDSRDLPEELLAKLFAK